MKNTENKEDKFNKILNMSESRLAFTYQNMSDKECQEFNEWCKKRNNKKTI